MNIKLVRIKDSQSGYKGTWYTKGELHFVTEVNEEHISCRYRALDISGGIMESDCELQKGLIAWFKCLIKTLAIKLAKQFK